MYITSVKRTARSQTGEKEWQGEKKKLKRDRPA
jgi:hypothetical protein